MAEEYYLIKKVKDCFFVEAFNTHIVKKCGKKLEVLTSEVIKPKEIGVKISEDGKGILCINKQYKIVKKITEERVRKEMGKMGLNYSNWQNYMSNEENFGSRNLTHQVTGERAV